MSAQGKSPGGEVLVYEAADGSVRVDVRLEQDTVWLTQRQMAELFESSTDNIGLHLKNIFSDNELQEGATTEDFSVVQPEGNRSIRRRVKHYNLDAIISVGYRVNSHRGVRFRQWATRTQGQGGDDPARDEHARGADRLTRFPTPSSNTPRSAGFEAPGYAVRWHSARKSVP